MSRRADPLIRDWETQLQANALASRILGTLSKRKSEVQRCALDGLQRENAEFARAASAQFRREALGHCNDILALMLAIAAGQASELQGDPLGFVKTQAERRARQQFPLAGSLNAYRLAHRGYWEVMRDSVANSESSESERTDCLMMLSEFLLEFFDRISGIMTDAYIAEAADRPPQPNPCGPDRGPAGRAPAGRSRGAGALRAKRHSHRREHRGGDRAMHAFAKRKTVR
jgi:hypothetical protein